MKSSFYLVVNSRGTTRTVKTRPGLDWDEVSIKIDLALPDTLFKKPQLSASIDVPEGKVKPFEITAETIDNIRDAIQAHTGIPIKLQIVNEEQLT